MILGYSRDVYSERQRSKRVTVKDKERRVKFTLVQSYMSESACLMV